MTALRKALFAVFAVAVAAVAAWAVAELFFVRGVSQMGRIRAAASAGALAMLFATFECIRRTQLRERYALLWIFPCFLMLVLAFFPRLLDFVRSFFGMEYSSILAAAAFLSLVFAMFVFSLAVSRDEANATAAVQRLAALEARVRELEAAAGKEPPMDVV